MKRKFTKLIAALALLVLIDLPIMVWAENKMINAGPLTNGVLTDSPFTLTFAKNGGSTEPTYNSNGGDLRLYAKGTVEVSSTGGNMTTIVFNISTQGKKRLAAITASVGTIATQSSGDETVTWTGDAASVTFTVGDIATYGTESTKAGQLCFGTVDITYTPSGGGGGDTPTITVNKNSLDGFTYNVGEGPSAVQTISVSGSNLGNTDITLEMNDGENSAFEMSLSENSGYNTSLTLPQSSGTVNSTTVYVRLKADKAIANYEDEINLTSSTASKTVSLGGSVIPASVSWDLTTAQFSSQSTDLVTWTDTHATMTVERNGSNSAANAYLGGTGNYTNTHFYTSHILTISPAPHWAISKIEITATSPSYANSVAAATWSNAAVSTNGSVVTVTPSNGDLDVSATFGSTVFVTGVVVYYAESTATFYTITVSESLNGNVVASYNEAIAGKTITLSVYPNAGYCLELSNITASGATVTKMNAATFTFTMPANNVTVNAEFSVYDGTYYTLVTSTDDLIPGRKYIIASSKTNGAAYAMGAQSNNNYRSQVAAVVAGTMIYETTGVAEIVLSGDATNHWTINDGSTPGGYLFAASGNYLKTLSSNSYTQAAQWAVTITNGEASIVSYVGNNVSNTIRHNPGSTRFSCYTLENTQAPVYLYMKANETNCKLYSATTIAKEVDCATCDLSHTNATLTIADDGILNCSNTITGATTAKLIIEDGGQLITNNAVNATMKKNIAAWTTDPVGGWYFIASPIDANDLNPSDVANMLTANNGDDPTYDLYKYVANNVVNDESKPWYNYRAHSAGFVLANGQGYLYANASDKTLAFAGAVKPYSTSSNTVTLAQTGWNLIGNPFTCAVSVNVAFSELNHGTAVTNKTVNSTIMPCAGIAVNGNANDVVTFTMVEPQQSAAPSNPSLQMTLSQQATNRGNANILDNAIVSFNEGNELGKFYFGEQNANLYIPQGAEEYAIVSSNAQGEMPVNFKANKNGEYTLTVNAENVEMNYLHLIDNMTGADIDLLATPSYTFNAKTTDYESRFRLVFAANNEDGSSTGSETFAFISDGNIIVNGEGVMQIIDVTGRVIRSTDVARNVSTSGMPAGVYVLRLINGDSVRTQKIVVR